jgi:hypothetical protein
MPGLAECVSYLDDRPASKRQIQFGGSGRGLYCQARGMIPRMMAARRSGSLLRAEGFDRVNGGGATRRQVAGQESCDNKADRNGCVGERVGWTHTE